VLCWLNDLPSVAVVFISLHTSWPAFFYRALAIKYWSSTAGAWTGTFNSWDHKFACSVIQLGEMFGLLVSGTSPIAGSRSSPLSSLFIGNFQES